MTKLISAVGDLWLGLAVSAATWYFVIVRVVLIGFSYKIDTNG